MLKIAAKVQLKYCQVDVSKLIKLGVFGGVKEKISSKMP